MRTSKILGIPSFTLAFALVAAATGFAKDARDLRLPLDAVVNGTRLEAGQYSVRLESHSPESTLTFQQKRKTVAMIPAKLEERRKKYPSNEVVYSMNPDGTRTITEIRLGGHSQAIVIVPTKSTSGALRERKPQS
jgi:hypothetical protein